MVVIVVAPNAFKECLTSEEAAQAFEKGVKESGVRNLQVVKIPLADGGDGTMNVIVDYYKQKMVSRPPENHKTITTTAAAEDVANKEGKSSTAGLQHSPAAAAAAAAAAATAEIVEIEVSDPLHRKVAASYGLIHHRASTSSLSKEKQQQQQQQQDIGKDQMVVTAVIEMASSVGLWRLKPEEKNPCKTSTFGLGEMILHAINNQPSSSSGGGGSRQEEQRRIIVCIGGSATNDGGVGMASALGYRFYDANNQEIGPRCCGGDLVRIRRICSQNVHPMLHKVRFIVATDVDNPLLGHRGATAVYAKQKGATPQQMIILERGLANLAGLFKSTFKKDLAGIPGSGAAGGLGAGMMAFCNGTLRGGFDLVSEMVHFRERVQGADLIITGEGRIDSSTINGKVPVGVARIAKELNIPAVAIGGSLGSNLQPLRDAGMSAFFSIARGPITLEASMKNASTLVSSAVREIAHLFSDSASHRLSRL